MATVSFPSRPAPDPGEPETTAPVVSASRFVTRRLAAEYPLAPQMIEYAPACMVALDPERLRVLLANRAARRLYARLSGGSGGLALGEVPAEALPWLEERGVLEQLRIVARTGEPMLELALEVDRAPGIDSPTCWSYDIVPLGEPREPAAQVLLVVNDRTEERRERQRAEQMAFSAQLYAEKLEAVIEQISEAVMVVDRGGQLLAYNRAALSFAANREAVERARSRGLRVDPEWDLASPDGAPLAEIERPAWRAMLTGAAVTGTQLIIRHDGAETPLLAHAAPLRDESGAITSAVVAFQDISAFKELERLKDEFISVASHELRQPLTVINGQAQLLKRHLRKMALVEASGDTLRQLAEGVEAQAARLNLLVSDLLDMSRIQADQLTLDPHATKLLPMLERLITQQRASSLDHDIRLECDPTARAGELIGRWDERRIEQIVMNLLNNAIKYSPSGGAVTVGVTLRPHGYTPETRLPGRPRRVAGPAAHVAISDHGIGIPPEAQKRLFERFYRARNTDGIQGTGLGLFICRQLAWAHGGDLWAESDGEGQGSAFHLVLPLA